jgi:transposase-like protein
MARVSRNAEFWARLVAEAKTSGTVCREVAAKHGVSESALRYHVYKARDGKRSTAILPVRVLGAERPLVEIDVGSGVRLRVADGCDPDFVVALVSRLRQC